MAAVMQAAHHHSMLNAKSDIQGNQWDTKPYNQA
jgi:hypothetical protein